MTSRLGDLWGAAKTLFALLKALVQDGDEPPPPL